MELLQIKFDRVIMRRHTMPELNKYSNRQKISAQTISIRNRGKKLRKYKWPKEDTNERAWVQAYTVYIRRSHRC